MIQALLIIKLLISIIGICICEICFDALRTSSTKNIRKWCREYEVVMIEKVIVNELLILT